MLKRLLENWLDSASERSYQSPFCQMLYAKGHTILHSTRHSSLEFGKDVLTIGPDGVPCAYQLKGNPGSRLTLNQFRNIQSQLDQLVTQPIIFPGLKIQPFNTYLVTNGIVDEEVQKALDELNRGFVVRNTLGKPTEIISRGHLLQWANELGTNLWPSELEDVNRLLQLLVTKGDTLFPAEIFHELLVPLLFLDDKKNMSPSANELKRRVTSAAILTAVCLRNFSARENHFAIITAWVMYCVYSIGSCERYNLSYKRNAKNAVDIACEAIFLSLSNLCDELQKRKHYVEGNALVDSFVYKGRYTLLVALMVIYWYWCENKEWPKKEHRDFLSKFIPRDQSKLYLWGEGAIPQVLIHLWYLRCTDATIAPDSLLASLLKQIVKRSLDEKVNGLPNPYYSFGSVIRHILREFLALKEDPFHGDSFRFDSFFALPLMHLLARTNMKQTCKAIWPDFSRLNFKHFEPAKTWMFCLKKSPDGVVITEQPKLTKDWKELVNEARDVSCKGIPDALKSDKFLLILFILLFPYRVTPSVIRYLGLQFNDSWSIEEPIS